MQAHTSQFTADSGDRTLAVVLRLPRLVFRLAFGREWFIERGRPAGGPPLDDIFASLRSSDAANGVDRAVFGCLSPVVGNPHPQGRNRASDPAGRRAASTMSPGTPAGSQSP